MIVRSVTPTLRRPLRRVRGIGSLRSVSYPTTGAIVSLDQLNAGWQAVSTPNFLTADASNIGQWGGIVAVNQSLTTQRAYIRSLYDSAVNTGYDSSRGGYWEPAYPDYVYSVQVPPDAQGNTNPATQEIWEQRAADEPITDVTILAQLTPSSSTSTSSATQQTSSAPASSAPPAQPVYTPSLQFQNLTTGDSSNFKAGDSWRLAITGAQPGAAITYRYTKNGAASATISAGTANASGAFTITGSPAAGDVGSWSEQWFVNGAQVAQLSFTVAAAQTTPASQPPADDAIDGTPASGGATDESGQVIVGGSVVDDIIGALPASLQSVAESIRTAASGMPTWAWLAIAAAALLYFHNAGGKKR